MSLVGDIINQVGDTAREILPDSDKRYQIDADSLSQQVEVNKIEAQSSSLFVAGWRPFIGWSTGAAVIYSQIIAPMFGLATFDPELTVQIVLGMLGINGGLRTYEKIKKVNQPQVDPPKKKSRWFK